MSKHGGKRTNQTGRPRKADKMIRIGTLFLEPSVITRLAELANDGETLLGAARRLLIACITH